MYVTRFRRARIFKRLRSDNAWLQESAVRRDSWLSSGTTVLESCEGLAWVDCFACSREMSTRERGNRYWPDSVSSGSVRLALTSRFELRVAVTAAFACQA